MSEKNVQLASRSERIKKIKLHHNAALIQSLFRGLIARKKFRILKDFKKRKEEEEEERQQLENADEAEDKLEIIDENEDRLVSEAIDAGVRESTLYERASRSSLQFASLQWPVPLVEDFNDSIWSNSVPVSLEDTNPTTINNILLRVVTWNLCAKNPPPIEEVRKLLFPNQRFHAIVVGSEECERSIAQSALNTSKKAWEAYLIAAIGDDYIAIAAHTLQAIHVILFVHKSIKHQCSNVVTAAVATGMGNTMGNKGAVGIAFSIGETRLLVVNAHLAAHDKAVKQRNADFERISNDLPVRLNKKRMEDKKHCSTSSTVSSNSTVSNNSTVRSINNSTVRSSSSSTPVSSTNVKSKLENSSRSVVHDDTLNIVNNERLAEEVLEPPAAEALSQSKNQGQSSSSSNANTDTSGSNIGMNMEIDEGVEKVELCKLATAADRVIFMGDLNYRIRGNRSIVFDLLEKNMHDVLLSNDQLKWSMANKLVLNGFIEPPLNFRPTYKFDVGSIDRYDSSPKHRIPAWTDRVLYVPGTDGGLQCLAYNADMKNTLTSDHRPVYATFLVHVQGLYACNDSSTEGVVEHTVKQTHKSESEVCNVM